MLKNGKQSLLDGDERHISYDDLPEPLLVTILQKVARDTGGGEYASVCRRWHRLMPQAQVHVKLVHKDEESPIPEASWVKLLLRLPNLETLDLWSNHPYSDFILLAIGWGTPRLEELRMHAEFERRGHPVPMDVEGWSKEGLGCLFEMKPDLKSLSLSVGMFFRWDLDLPESLTCLTQLESLRCSGLGEYAGAEVQLDRLATLKELDLGWSHYGSDVPDTIAGLPNLTSLTLKECDELPEELGSLSKLEQLHLIEARVSSLPDSIMRLSLLTSLTLILVPVEDLEEEEELALQHLYILQGLAALRELEPGWVECGVVPDGVVPDTITMLSNLTKLTLNDFTSLPSELGSLSKLKHLHLRNGKILSLPASIMSLTELTSLTLHSVDITELPQGMRSQPALQQLQIGNCKYLDEHGEIKQKQKKLKKKQQKTKKTWTQK